MSNIAEWLDPSGCPTDRPPVSAMSAGTRALHDALDAHARRTGLPYLHPDEPTVQLDLFGSARAIEWQERKAAFLFATEGCWSELPHLYARYGTTATAALIARLKDIERAGAVLVCDSGMQATALTFDALMAPGSHAVLMRQIYNKTRTYAEWLAARLGGSVTTVDDGDMPALASAIRPQTRFVFAETFTNPLVRAQDLDALREVVARARRPDTDLKLVVDSTIATPWAFAQPLLDQGVDIIVGSGTKSLSGSDRDLWGYIATRDTPFANAVMDLMAMRGGILDWRRATAILTGLDEVDAAHAQRSASASRVAAFLASHPKVGDVFHPSLPNHPDAAAIAKQYIRYGSLLSFRVAGADEDRTRHYADVLATCVVVRYALSFDGLTTKVNHHKTVSEYFTPPAALRRNGFDRLIRLAVGMEDANDVIACLNWTLHHADSLSPAEVEAWQVQRAEQLGVVREDE
ncbi:MAG: PLP-dependent transferase [Acidobacteria bacterium]|nr:PLP-dependent transferase [Acidobacteriota bacterium]